MTDVRLADTSYMHVEARKTIAAALLEIAVTECKNDKYVPIFVNVGSPSSSGDAVGPLVGWFLKHKGYDGLYVGDTDNPVYATNLRERINDAWNATMRLGKFPFMVGVDAAIGRPGRITVDRGPLKPGAGMGKALPEVGVANVMCGTADMAVLMHFTDIGRVLAMAEVVADGIIEFYAAWKATQNVRGEAAAS